MSDAAIVFNEQLIRLFKGAIKAWEEYIQSFKKK